VIDLEKIQLRIIKCGRRRGAASSPYQDPGLSGEELDLLEKSCLDTASFLKMGAACTF
jgi:hypothetical protein